jgi:hypothetical protein
MEFGPPDRVVDFDPENAVFDLECARVLRNLRTDGPFPRLHSDRLFQPGLEGGISGANLCEDVLDGVEAHRVRPKYMIRRTLASCAALLTFFAGSGVGLSGCSYAFENSRTNSLKDINVTSIYVAPAKNLSFKPGVENVVYNELVQALLTGHRVKLVDRPELADALLETRIERALYTRSADTDAASVFPIAVNAIQIRVATEYQAEVLCSFHLKRQRAGVGAETLWESSFSRQRRFAANNQKIEFGTTSGLINESEFDRTLQEVAHGMMQDVQEAMVARF